MIEQLAEGARPARHVLVQQLLADVVALGRIGTGGTIIGYGASHLHHVRLLGGHVEVAVLFQKLFGNKLQRTGDCD